MTKLLEKVIARLRKMPNAVQDLAAARLLRLANERPEPDELAAISEGRRAFPLGKLTSLDQWRRDDVERRDQ